MSDFTARTVVVMGQGYVGVPLAVRAAEAGHHVVGFEPDPRRLGMLAEGRSYVEDIPAARLRSALASGHYRPTCEADDLACYDVAVIAVPTPLRDRVPDLSAVEDAAATLSPYLRPGATVVLESTTYPGTTDEIVGPVLEGGSGLCPGADFHLGYSSERIDPGNGRWTLDNTPKLVSGVDETSLKAIAEFYATFVDQVVPVSRPCVAELAKLIENTFRHVNIALVNELAMFASELDIDIGEAIDAAATKPFGFMPFYPGPGLGGHCIPIDPFYLSWKTKQSGIEARFIELAGYINGNMPHFVVDKVQHALNNHAKPVKGSRVHIIGVAYKRNIDDMRESPALDVILLLKKLGAEVSYSDPFVPRLKLDGIDLASQEAMAAAKQADCVVIITDHSGFDYEELLESANLIVDTRNAMRGFQSEKIVRL